MFSSPNDGPHFARDDELIVAVAVVVGVVGLEVVTAFLIFPHERL